MKTRLLTTILLAAALLLLQPLCASADPVSDEQVAIAAERSGDSDTALLLYQSALDGFSNSRDYSSAARVAQSLMLLQISLGDIEAAMGSAAQARDMLLQAGLPDRAAQLSSQLGSVLKARSEYSMAAQSYQVALEIYEQSGNGYGRAGTLMNLGVLAELLNDPARSAEYFELAGMEYLDLDDERGLMTSYASAGQAHLNAGEPQEAEQDFRQALFLCGKLDDPHACASQRLGLSRALREMGSHEEALETTLQALATLAEKPDDLIRGRIMLEQGRILAELGRSDNSLEALMDAWDLFELASSPGEQAAMALELIEAARRAGRQDLVERYREQRRLLNASF